MANKSSKAKTVALRKAGKHFHGEECNTALRRSKAGRKPRDEQRKLLGIGTKRQLDKRITGGFLKIYA